MDVALEAGHIIRELLLRISPEDVKACEEWWLDLPHEKWEEAFHMSYRWADRSLAGFDVALPSAWSSAERTQVERWAALQQIRWLYLGALALPHARRQGLKIELVPEEQEECVDPHLESLVRLGRLVASLPGEARDSEFELVEKLRGRLVGA